MKCPFCGEQVIFDPDSPAKDGTDYLAHLLWHGVIEGTGLDLTQMGEKQAQAELFKCCCGYYTMGYKHVYEHLHPDRAHVAECAMLISAGHGFKYPF